MGLLVGECSAIPKTGAVTALLPQAIPTVGRAPTVATRYQPHSGGRMWPMAQAMGREAEGEVSPVRGDRKS